MKLGKNFMLGIVDDEGRFQFFAFAQSCSIDMRTASTEVSSPKTGGWVNRRAKRNSWAMQHEGLLGSDIETYTYKGKEYGFWDLMSALWEDRATLTARWIESGGDGQAKEGECIIDNLRQVASDKALTKVSVALSGSGELRNLNKDDLEGSFAYVVNGNALSLYALARPFASFTVRATVDVHGTPTTYDVGEWNVTGVRTQTITDPHVAGATAISAVRNGNVQQRVTFTDSSTLHVVMLQTEWRDSQQQLHRSVQPLWWGGYALGDMTLKKGSTEVATFATAGKAGSAAAVEVETDITEAGTWTIEISGDSGQTAHCCDRTTSLNRTLNVWQTTSNIEGGTPYFGICNIQDAAGDAQKFRCNYRIWANDNEGNEIFSIDESTLFPLLYLESLVPAADNMHWQLQGLGVDEEGPWHIARTLNTDTAPFTVYYAYNATAQKLRLFSPDQKEDGLSALMLDGETYGDFMRFFDLDGEGRRTPVTLEDVPAFSTIGVAFGNATFHDVSTVAVINLSNTFTIGALPLDDVQLTGTGGTVLATLPMLSDPALTYTFPGVGGITGAQMASGAAQTATYTEYAQTVVVSTSITQTGNAQWTVKALLHRANVSTGEAVEDATLPGDLSINWAGRTLTILAGQHEATDTGFTADVSWQTPAVTLNHWSASDFTIWTGVTVDATAARWRADYLGTLDGLRYLDISYTGTIPTGISVALGEGFTGEVTVDSGRLMADKLFQTNRPSGDYSFTARVGLVGSVVRITPQEFTNNPVELTYVVRAISAGNTTDLTNRKPDGVTLSRHTNIGELLHFVRVRRSGGYTFQDAPFYAPVALSALKPGQPDAVAEYARSGVVSDDENGLVEFVNTANQADTNVISVGNNLPGLLVYAYNHTALLPKA